VNCSVSNDATGPALFGCAPGLLEMASRLNEAPDVPFEELSLHERTQCPTTAG